MRRDGNRGAEEPKSEIAGCGMPQRKTRARFNMTRVLSGSVNSRSRRGDVRLLREPALAPLLKNHVVRVDRYLIPQAQALDALMECSI